MPELPDLLYIQSYLDRNVRGRTLQDAVVRKPFVLRVMTEGDPATLLRGACIEGIDLHGPFLGFALSGPVDLVVNLMLAGRVQHQRPSEKAEGHLCLRLPLDDGTALNLCDREDMAKMYLVPRGSRGAVPAYATQGIDVLSSAFTADAFAELARAHGRKQVRSFINDHRLLSSIGNAYADEILFEAKLHPKTFVARLTPEQVAALHGAIRSVLAWGAECVRAAAEPINVKVRGHLRVRNRHGQPCPRCGTTIRREGVRGYDVFFCPSCQPAARRLFIDWTSHQRPGNPTLQK
jgi:formamidopyrimidine-DNA glycosylase